MEINAVISIMFWIVFITFGGLGGNIMASENKKRKAKNSYCYNGAEKYDFKMKRFMYFNKRQRKKNNKICMDEQEE